MTVKGLLKTAALALGVVSGATAYAAGAYGDIYDIRACEMDTDGNWVVRDAWATAENPLEAGQTAYFMMRLLRSNTTDSDEGKATQWDLTLKGIGTTPSTMAEWMEWAAALASTPFGITVYVSGEERAANVCDWKRNEETGMTTEYCLISPASLLERLEEKLDNDTAEALLKKILTSRVVRFKLDGSIFIARPATEGDRAYWEQLLGWIAEAARLADVKR